VADKNDTVESHIADTLDAGAGLCSEKVVRKVTTQGPKALKWLLDAGVPFTKDETINSNDIDGLHLTREGGHSKRRVAHAADASGYAIETTLLGRVKLRSNISLFEFHIAVDLITSRKLKLLQRNNVSLGAYVLNRKTQKISIFKAKFTILATGGASKVYLYTSNPDGASGDGIAMAWRAGCRVSNMEFMQFHPTCLYHPYAKSYLITEAVRGEGGKLLLPDGTRFMDKYDTRAELAPRDIVARAIDHEMKCLGIDSVYIDISHRSKKFITEHFPNVYATCEKFGYDMSKNPIPVVPAAHYTCGGVVVDEHGQTDVDNLYAIGECSFTGLHGANRMASNSLLECIVYGQFCAEDIIKKRKNKTDTVTIPEWDESRVTDSDEHVIITHNWDEIRRFMWDYVGIVRTTKRLERARTRIDMLLHEIDEYYTNFRITSDLLELRNLAEVARLIIRSAQRRKESRGLHYTLDHPQADPNLEQVNSILDPIRRPSNKN
jgi:L-aspartate oxidase